jgi:glycosyltransferase involved in cell wall biosynthesis
MKLLLVCGAGYIGGKEVMALELSRGLQSSGHDIHLIVSSWNDSDFPSRLKEADLPFKLLPIGFISATLTPTCIQMTLEQLVRWPGLLLEYRRFLKRLRPTRVIHTNWHHLLLLFPFLNSKRDLFWLHEVIPTNRHYRAVFRSFSRRLQSFVVVSHAVGESLRRIGIPEQKIRMIHNGLSDPARDLEAPPESKSGVRLGIAGQVGAWKGHEDLLDAFRHIAVQRPGVELHIFGQGAKDYEQQLRRQAAEFGITSQVKWHGFVKDRVAIFNNIDICVVPSRSEDPFPTVAIEAAGFGLPVVATRRGGLPEIVVDGVTGILVPPKDPPSLAKAIERLLADPGLCRDMGTKARERMLVRFSTGRFITEFSSLLQEQT